METRARGAAGLPPAAMRRAAPIRLSTGVPEQSLRNEAFSPGASGPSLRLGDTGADAEPSRPK